MSKSPGHQELPDHKVIEQHLDARVQITVDGEVIADSADVIKVEEDEDPYDEHEALKERLAFYDEKVGGMQVTPRA